MSPRGDFRRELITPFVMEEAATIYEVARDSGVTLASVSRGLHGQPGVSTATQRRVHIAKGRLDQQGRRRSR
jgi:hypothetical protein